MKEVGQYTKAEPIKEGMLAVMALAQADLQMGKGRTIVEEVFDEENRSKGHSSFR